MPEITIVIPVYNQEQYISKAIDSALRQTYRKCSILVVDDGSTDATSEILGRYKDRITVIRQTNAGTSAAWNTAIDRSSTDFLIGLDADDEYVPTTVNDVVAALEAHPVADLVYSDFAFIDAAGYTTKTVCNPDPQDPLQQLITLHDRLGMPDNFLPFGHVRLYRKDKLIEIGGYDTRYLYAEDYDLTLRLAEAGANFVHIPKVLYRYRWHDSNKGVLSRKQQKEDVRNSLSAFRDRRRYRGTR